MCSKNETAYKKNKKASENIYYKEWIFNMLQIILQKYQTEFS